MHACQMHNLFVKRPNCARIWAWIGMLDGGASTWFHIPSTEGQNRLNYSVLWIWCTTHRKGKLKKKLNTKRDVCVEQTCSHIVLCFKGIATFLVDSVTGSVSASIKIFTVIMLCWFHTVNMLFYWYWTEVVVLISADQLLYVYDCSTCSCVSFLFRCTTDLNPTFRSFWEVNLCRPKGFSPM